MPDTKPVPPTGSAEGETAALQAQVVEASTINNHDGKIDNRPTGAVAGTARKEPDAGMKNYLVGLSFNVNLQWLMPPQRVFKYGTALDYFLIALCCITSVGSGIVSQSWQLSSTTDNRKAFPIMNIVFGMFSQVH